MNTSFYKCCAVPMCKSTSISTPQKLFIYVPKSAKIRRKWLKLARRHPGSLSPTSTSYFCEDHFDLQNDMENYIEYTTMGGVSRIRMRPGCLPSKFDCQPTRASISVTDDDDILINECEDEIGAVGLQQSGALYVEVPSLDQDIPKTDEAAQIPTKFQSETMQVKAKSCTKQTSMTKDFNTSVETSVVRNDDKSDRLNNLPDSSPFYGPGLKRVAYLKCMVEHAVDKIKKRPLFYIGVPKNCYALIQIIQEQTGISENNILLCLKKIRLNSKFSELADEFEISTSNACKIFKENIPKMAEIMKLFIVKLDKSYIKSCLPIVFRKNYNDLTCIINCLEIEIQKPGNALNQSLTWSECKNTNTLKYLISSTPNGLVNYVSRGYGGKISDVSLVEDCGFLNCLAKKSHVMAGRGFKHIEPLHHRVGSKVIRPPRKVSFNEVSKEEVKIVSLWIHIERVIRCIRKFSLLNPQSCVSSNFLGQLDDVIVIACGLINLQNSLYRNNSEIGNKRLKYK